MKKGFYQRIIAVITFAAHLWHALGGSQLLPKHNNRFLKLPERGILPEQQSECVDWIFSARLHPISGFLTLERQAPDRHYTVKLCIKLFAFHWTPPDFTLLASLPGRKKQYDSSFQLSRVSRPTAKPVPSTFTRRKTSFKPCFCNGGACNKLQILTLSN